MADEQEERLELTFTGLCAFDVGGYPYPTGAKVYLLNAPGGDHVEHPHANAADHHHPRENSRKATKEECYASPHTPLISFRGIDLVDVSIGDNSLESSTTRVSVLVTPEGQEIINLPIPFGSDIGVFWESDSLDTKFTLAWEDGASTPPRMAPDLRDFNISEIHVDRAKPAAIVEYLPFGRLEARRFAKTRDPRELEWYFDEDAESSYVFSNQITLVSRGNPGDLLKIEIGPRTYSFLTGDGDVPLRIAVSNLPAEGLLIEPPLNANESPPHLHWYDRLAKDPSAVKLFKLKADGATRQGTICPAVRFEQ